MNPVQTARLSRRRLLGGVAGLGILNAAGIGLSSCARNSAVTSDQTVPFYGAHQAGITTDIQDRLVFAAFDVTTTRREDLQKMLKTWTAAAAAMTAGAMVPGDSHADEIPPADTGEAVGLPPSHFRYTSAPTSSETIGACTSGVSPSSRLMTGSPSANGR